MNYSEKRVSQLDGGHRHTPDWLQPYFDLEEGKNLPSPVEVSAFLQTYPVFRNKQRAGQVAERLKEILFHYQKSDSVSRFERSRLLKEREKNLKKVTEWDSMSEKLERGLAKGLAEVDRQSKEIEKLKLRLSRAVAGKVEDEGLIREEDLKDGGWSDILDLLMSKRNELSNEDVRVKISLLDLMGGLSQIRDQQLEILEQSDFGVKKFVGMVDKYIDKGERDYQKYLDLLAMKLNDNVELERLNNESSFAQRQLDRARRRESQVKYKRQTLELKKSILDIMEKMKIDYPEGYEDALKKLDFEVLEETKDSKTDKTEIEVENAIRSSRKEPYNRHKNLDHKGQIEMQKILDSDKIESERKIFERKTKAKDLGKKKRKSQKSKNKQTGEKKTNEKENLEIKKDDEEIFDVNKIKQIDRMTSQEIEKAKSISNKKNSRSNKKTSQNKKRVKNSGKISRFVYTPRKCKSVRQRQKEFNEKIVNRIKKITNKYVS